VLIYHYHSAELKLALHAGALAAGVLFAAKSAVGEGAYR
jgi:hypothetical protein